MLLRLSHTMRIGDPGYAGPISLAIKQRSSFATGASQTFNIGFMNHDGTHIDAPNHFNPKGRPVAEMSPEEFLFRAPIVLDIPKTQASLITRSEIERFKDEINGKDALLIRTGYAAIRDVDPEKFSNDTPCLAPDAARYIVEELPDVRCIGVDCVSVGSPRFPKETTESHRILTGFEGYGSRSVLIVEDMNLNHDLQDLKWIIVVPLFIEGVDSTPCTVFAEVEP